MLRSAIGSYIKNKLADADVKIDGERPWDIKVRDKRFYTKVLLKGSLGFGESYMDHWFDVEQVDEAVTRILQVQYDKQPNPLLQLLSKPLINKQSKKRALTVGKQHYDLSNKLFQCMLDKRMAYSCGYWKDAANLDEAQENKLRLVCEKISLKPGMRVLDIGCGWGSFSRYAAENYGANVVGITISQEQLEFARELHKGWPIEFRFQDYRDLNEKFDRIVSIGQMEHVGYRNYREYMQIASRCLKDEGLFLLHTIGSNVSTYSTDPWIDKYIFPNGQLPSCAQLAQAAEGLFVMEDWHNFGADYDKTLIAWNNNFEAHWNELKSDYDQRFYRMWRYYLLTCAAAFRSRQIQLWQIAYSKKGVPGGYTTVR